MANLERRYAHFQEWEDYHAGLYAEPSPVSAEHDRSYARSLLADPPALYAAMRWVTEDWTTASEVVLTSTMNHQAWLGQSAACIMGGVPATLTKEAWWLLTPEQRAAANEIADTVIAEWRAANAETSAGN